MNYSMIRYISGWILMLQGGFMLLPVLVSGIYNEKYGLVFLGLALCLAAVGGICIAFKPKNKTFRAREGFVTVAIAWILLSLTGALPYTLGGSIPNYIDAVFETASGYTTTGASILSDCAALPNCVNFWHCFTIWIGGMGVLVFMLAILPLAGGNNIFLLKAESPGPVVGKILPKMKNSAKILYLIYVALTALEMIVLKISGLPFFESFCMALSNAGTGGFGVRTDGTFSYTPAQQIIFTVFMFLFSINFTIYFLMITRKWKEIWKNEELKWFLAIVAFSGTAIALNIRSIYGTWGEAFRHSFFQVLTAMSTTGFASTDFNIWPTFSKVMLIVLMFCGGCAGSTCGGMKISRFVILIKSFFKETNTYIHPKSVKTVKMDGKRVENETISGVQTYAFAYLIIFVASLLLLSVFGTEAHDFETIFSAVTACLNNIGPGLGLVGPTSNFNCLGYAQKIVLTLDMIIGRLEVFPMLLLVAPATWRKN